MQSAATQQRKQFFPINQLFRDYLSKYDRSMDLPVTYEDMLKYEDSFPLISTDGKDTLWQTLIYEQQFGRELYDGRGRLRRKQRRTASRPAWFCTAIPRDGGASSSGDADMTKASHARTLGSWGGDSTAQTDGDDGDG